MNALETIGPAVFNGGFTTLLAVIVMAFSKSSVFLTFFKVNIFWNTLIIPRPEVVFRALGGVGGGGGQW